MNAKSVIYSKLELFIKKFYYNEIIKGTLLFIAIGLLYFIFTLLIEHFLWLSTTGRTILFWLFVAVEFFLLANFIFFPVFKLFKIQSGLTHKEASLIIGNHFTEVKDKLLNFIQLETASEQSELVLASIEQKAAQLQPIPFTNAVNYSGNKRWIPFAILPILLLILFFATGNTNMITNSFDRVMHFQKQYAPPAPFEITILNSSLQVNQFSDYVLEVKTIGSIVPENIAIQIGDEEYLLNSVQPGIFTYTFKNVAKNMEFTLFSNTVSKPANLLQVVYVPSISDFKMVLNYPKYLNKKQEVISGSGNAIVPEGTLVNWELVTAATSKINFISNNNTSDFKSSENIFTFSKQIRASVDYQIVTSNANLANYEKIDYKIDIIKDKFPSINAYFAPDSLKVKDKIIIGQLADDYGISKLQVVYYPKDQPAKSQKVNLTTSNGTVSQFVYVFPKGITLQEGVQYEYYFEVFDNDIVNSYKSTKSSVFKHYQLTSEEIIDKNLQDQNSNINSLEKSLKAQDKQLSELEKLQKTNKEKNNLDFKDQKKVDDFVNKQKLQDEMMKEFSKKLSDNLEKFNPNELNKEKEELVRRLDDFAKKTEKEEQLLKQLEELSKKINKEQLQDKVDQLKQSAKSQKMSLEQLVELTKRFYVEQKAQQLTDKLNTLADKEEKLANEKEANTKEKQDAINKEFDSLKKELEELQKENDQLKKPLEIPSDKLEEQAISKEMENAADKLDKNKKEDAKENQKSAAKKMKEMANKMQKEMDSGKSDQLQEDAKQLRQILDNLLSLSFDQEKVMLNTKNNATSTLQINQYLKKQQELKLQFKHVDDSVFALSLRNPMITEKVLEQISLVHYNMDKAIEFIPDNAIAKGASHQQYALTAINMFTNFLSQIQNDMQMQGQGMGKPKKGKGQGAGMQLPDIIKKQGELGEKMQGEMGKGKKPGEKEGDSPGEKPGEKPGSKPGDSGSKGSEGKNGKDGQNGKSGQSGQSGSNGEGEGESGENGNAGKVLDILKQQQQLRDALQKALEKEGATGLGHGVLNQMKDIEKQLINKGFKNDVLNKILNVKHELLKLETAIQQQGEDTKRKATTNQNTFSGSTTPLSVELQDYLKSIEILNRQTLPLQPNFNQKVQLYFKKND